MVKINISNYKDLEYVNIDEIVDFRDEINLYRHMSVLEFHYRCLYKSNMKLFNKLIKRYGEVYSKTMDKLIDKVEFGANKYTKQYKDMSRQLNTLKVELNEAHEGLGDMVDVRISEEMGEVLKYE